MRRERFEVEVEDEDEDEDEEGCGTRDGGDGCVGRVWLYCIL